MDCTPSLSASEVKQILLSSKLPEENLACSIGGTSCNYLNDLIFVGNQSSNLFWMQDRRVVINQWGTSAHQHDALLHRLNNRKSLRCSCQYDYVLYPSHCFEPWQLCTNSRLQLLRFYPSTEIWVSTHIPVNHHFLFGDFHCASQVFYFDHEHCIVCHHDDVVFFWGIRIRIRNGDVWNQNNTVG